MMAEVTLSVVVVELPAADKEDVLMKFTFSMSSSAAPFRYIIAL